MIRGPSLTRQIRLFGEEMARAPGSLLNPREVIIAKFELDGEVKPLDGFDLVHCADMGIPLGSEAIPFHGLGHIDWRPSL
jgi:hypothetical protein